jgi:hypothetical protein
MKGDVLASGGIVECVVETVENAACKVVWVNGVAFTPYHPIVRDEKWVFPRDIGEIEEAMIDSWFNLVLCGNKIVELNGVKAITLGHNLKGNVLGHPYFGTEVVVNALKRYPGYSEGKLKIMHPLKAERDANGMVAHLF